MPPGADLAVRQRLRTKLVSFSLINYLLDIIWQTVEVFCMMIRQNIRFAGAIGG
jgi:hypothetical protein